MSLDLNPKARKFEEYSYGSTVEQMLKLIDDGRVPMNAFQLMQKRLGVRNIYDSLKNTWMNHSFDIGDTIIYNEDRVKFVLDSPYLREITPETPRNNGAFVLTPEQYDAMDGEELKRGKLGKIGFPLSKKDAKAHPIWKILARDQSLLDAYVDLVFAEGKERFCYDAAMGIFINLINENTPEMKILCVERLGSMDYDHCRSSLVGSRGRLVGVVPRVLSAKISRGNKIRTYTRAELDAFDKAMKELKGGLEGVIIDPKWLKPLADFRKKFN